MAKLPQHCQWMMCPDANHLSPTALLSPYSSPARIGVTPGSLTQSNQTAPDWIHRTMWRMGAHPVLRQIQPQQTGPRSNQQHNYLVSIISNDA